LEQLQKPPNKGEKMKKRMFRLIAICLAVLGGTWQSAKADVMDVDVSGVDPAFQSYFKRAESFWESRLIGYNGNLPTAVKRQLGKLQITASTAAIDGVGGILGSAGPNQILRYGGGTANGRPIQQFAIAQTGGMQFDSADLQNMLQNGTLENVIRHEMAHVLGIGTLWIDNGLRNATARGDYIGKHGLAAYRRESNNRFAAVVPIEQFGGPGTAGGHWDSLDPFFNKRDKNNSSELMIGNIGPDEAKFVSETTWGSLRDMWFAFKGDKNVLKVRSRAGTFVQPPKQSQFMTAVPEPGSAGVLLIGTIFAAFGFRRRK
jgi:hypothetical protein